MTPTAEPGCYDLVPVGSVAPVAARERGYLPYSLSLLWKCWLRAGHLHFPGMVEVPGKNG